jgi:hypothetical protein
MFTFIETSSFEKTVGEYLSDYEYSGLQQHMLMNPTAGDVVPKSGGVRKLRWRIQGKGKRGGVRVIYYVRYNPNEFWMLAIYAKSQQENAPAHILNQLRKAIENE